MDGSTYTTAERDVGLPNELWINSLSYLDPKDLLHSVGRASRNFLALSSSDSLWAHHCSVRWRGKQNVGRFFRWGNNGNSMNSAEKRGGEDDDGRVRYCADLIHQFGQPENIPALNMGSLMREPKSWKEAYLMAEMDSSRKIMTREELSHFKWQLVYDGAPSRMGLRQFDLNGTYWSPYIGVCEWLLHGNHLMFAGMTLLVERDLESWGWIIGRGQRTVYHSVEVSTA